MEKNEEMIIERDFNTVTMKEMLDSFVSKEFTSSAMINEALGIRNREILIEDVEEDTGSWVSSYVKLWNRMDDEAGIPVEERKPITVYIDSYGGVLTSGFSIVDAFEVSKTPIHTVNIGKAYSAGALIFLAGHKRTAYKRSSFLFHEGSAGVSGDANKLRNFSEFYDRQLKMLGQYIIERTNISEELYEKHDRDDWWLMGQELLDLGIIHEFATEII